MSSTSKDITKEIVVALIAADRIVTAEDAANAYSTVLKTVNEANNEPGVSAKKFNF